MGRKQGEYCLPGDASGRELSLGEAVQPQSDISVAEEYPAYTPVRGNAEMGLAIRNSSSNDNLLGMLAGWEGYGPGRGPEAAMLPQVPV